MKALVLAGGRGSRVNEISEEMNKCMLPFRGKPLLKYNLQILAGLDAIDEIVIVVGYKAEDIINRYGISFEGKRIQYSIQHEQRGLVHAIDCSRKMIDGDFLLMLGDEIMLNPQHQAMIEKFSNQDQFFSVCGVVKVDDRRKIRKTYSIFHDEQGRIFRLVEKPKKPFNNLMGTGSCIFRKEIFSYIEQTPINQERKEKELPDLIQCAIDDGNPVNLFEICSRYINVNSEKDLKEAEGLFSQKGIK